MGVRVLVGFLVIGYFLVCYSYKVEDESSERTATEESITFSYDSNETTAQSNTESLTSTTHFRPSKKLFENVYILSSSTKDNSKEVSDKLDTSIDLNQTFYSPVPDGYLSSIMVLQPQVFDYKFNDEISLNSEEIKPTILTTHIDDDQHMDGSIVYGNPIPLEPHSTTDLTSDNLNSYEKKEKDVHNHQHKHFHDHEHNQKYSHKYEQEHMHNHSHGHKHESKHDHGHQGYHENQHTSNHQHVHEGNHQHEHRGVHHHSHKGAHKHDHQHNDNHWHKEKQHHNHQHKSTHAHHHYGNHGHDHKHEHAHRGKYERHHQQQEGKHHRHHHEHKHGQKRHPQQTIVIKKHHY